VREWTITAAVLYEGSRRPSAWSYGSSARNALAGAEDLGERDCLERDVHVCGDTLEQRHTLPEHVLLRHARVQKLRIAAKDDLMTVVIVKEQLEVI